MLYGLLGFMAEDRIIVIGNRMRNDRKGIARHARHLRHGLGRLHEAVGNDRRGGDPGFLGGDGVVQTAR